MMVCEKHLNVFYLIKGFYLEYTNTQKTQYLPKLKTEKLFKPILQSQYQITNHPNEMFNVISN